jgi:formamidopyrimidine-DNA glycosylase
MYIPRVLHNRQALALARMPELPEIEHAAARARRVAAGRIITSVRLLHASQRRRLPPAALRRLRWQRVLAVERRGKTQCFRLTSGDTLEVHFRMTGDWVVARSPRPLPRHARAVISFDDGTRLVLDDPRALSVLTLASAGSAAPPIGPDAASPLDPSRLADALAKRRIPIKQALLDQRVISGLGNIYAAEALWHARIDPRTPANGLSAAQRRSLARDIRVVIRTALTRKRRYYGAGDTDWTGRFAVYDREGLPCRRCRTKVRRITQAGRSTCFCPSCQT